MDTDRTQRSWLTAFSKRLADSLRDRTAQADRITVWGRSKIRVEPTETGGWSVGLGRVRGDRSSSLEVWFDHWPLAAQRKLYVCYYSGSIEFVMKLAEATTAEVGQFAKLPAEGSTWNPATGYYQLLRPLPNELYAHPVAELFPEYGGRAYFGRYFRKTPDVDREPADRLIEVAAQFLEVACRGAVATLAGGMRTDREYPSSENRIKVRQHLTRDRSPRVAALAKVRDGFTCQICGFNFADQYGDLGRDFAEAHHRTALASRKGAVRSTSADLVTVCANCHRMLHRMNGTSADVATLKRIVSRRQASVK